MRRALLLFNPEATSVSPRVRDVIARALASEVTLETAETKRRHHATHLAAGAVHEGFDLLVCLGGDGTLNEVVNGLAGSRLPVVPLPGGGTNVFARTMGLPKDPIEATAVVIERLHEGAAPKRINLGRVNGRAFAFCAGVGFDAALVRAVERRMRLKKRIGEPYFVAQGLRTFFLAYSRKDPPLALHEGDRTVEGLHLVIVCNSTPYTFLGDRPFRLCPDAGQSKGLDVTALHSLGTVFALRVLRRAFGDGGHVRFRKVTALHDVNAFRVEATRPIPYQVDGDYAGEATAFEFETVRDALSVLA